MGVDFFPCDDFGKEVYKDLSLCEEHWEDFLFYACRALYPDLTREQFLKEIYKK